MKKQTKKYGLSISFRDWKQRFDQVQEEVNKALKLIKKSKIVDDEWNAGDDNIYTLVTNYPTPSDFEEIDLVSIIFSESDNLDDDGNIWFDTLEELKSLQTVNS